MTSVSLRRLCSYRTTFQRQIHSLRLYSLSVAPVKLKQYNRSLLVNSCDFSLTKKIRYISTDKPGDDGPESEKKPGLVQRFKQMYRDYWYVLLPVHVVTSTAWFAGFYYATKSGVDIVGIMESIGFSESITSHLKDSSMGYVAVAYALYKIATPIRYTVTLGGTTISINYLRDWGYIKPVPSKEKLKEMYEERKEAFQEKRDSLFVKMREKKDELKLPKEHLKSGKDGVADEIEPLKKELKDNTKDK